MNTYKPFTFFLTSTEDELISYIFEVGIFWPVTVQPAMDGRDCQRINVTLYAEGIPMALNVQPKYRFLMEQYLVKRK